MSAYRQYWEVSVNSRDVVMLGYVQKRERRLGTDKFHAIFQDLVLMVIEIPFKIGHTEKVMNVSLKSLRQRLEELPFAPKLRCQSIRNIWQ